MQTNIKQVELKQYITCQNKLLKNPKQPKNHLIKFSQYFMKFVPFRGDHNFPWNIPKIVFD